MGKQIVTFVIMSSAKEFKGVDVSHYIPEASVIGIVGSLFAWVDRVFVTTYCRKFPFLIHVCSPHKLDSGYISLISSPFMELLQILESVLAVHLEGMENDGPLFVEGFHRLFCYLVNDILCKE